MRLIHLRKIVYTLFLFIGLLATVCGQSRDCDDDKNFYLRKDVRSLMHELLSVYIYNTEWRGDGDYLVEIKLSSGHEPKILDVKVDMCSGFLEENIEEVFKKFLVGKFFNGICGREVPEEIYIPLVIRIGSLNKHPIKDECIAKMLMSIRPENSEVWPVLKSYYYNHLIHDD